MNEPMETLSEEQSPEDKFLGTRTPVFGDEDEAPEIEVIDDRPPEDQRPRAADAISDDDGDDDLESYSKGVQKRIKRLSFEKNEIRRQKEEAERMREEAVRYAQSLAGKNQEYEQIISSGEVELVSRIKNGAELALSQSREAYKHAFESGDTEKMVAAQEALNKAQYEYESASGYERDLSQRQQWAQQPQQQPQQPQRPQPQRPPQPSVEAKAWAEENPWFGSEDHKDMTALAYGIHEKLVGVEGVNPNTEEYYMAINNEMRRRFPDYFEGDNQGSGRQPVSSSRRPATTVAPSARSNGAKPRKVKLTSTQVALAKRLGLSPEQYANQVAKEL